MNLVETAVLELIKKTPMTSQSVRQKLSQFDHKEVRNAIARLWDSGYLNVGLDHLLRPTYGS